jgi:hypothetical protein
MLDKLAEELASTYSILRSVSTLTSPSMTAYTIASPFTEMVRRALWWAFLPQVVHQLEALAFRILAFK